MNKAQLDRSFKALGPSLALKKVQVQLADDGSIFEIKTVKIDSETGSILIVAE